jgi:glutamine synthetase
VKAWLESHAIVEVECVVADIAGIARGKILPIDKFLGALDTSDLRLPRNLFFQTVTGDWAETEAADPTEPDMILRPDPATLRRLPWYDYAAAQVTCDCLDGGDSLVDVAPRAVLHRVLDLYAERGWRPIVAPELEFYLVERNTDPDQPLVPPKGRSGRAESAGQAFGIDATNDFDPVIDQIYDLCEAQDLAIDTLVHEVGPAQFEINFRHGDALSLADQVFLFKRTVREAAHRHDLHATFMATPMSNQPGNAMHLHQSIVDASGGGQLFADGEGNDTELFAAHIAGLQRHLPAAMTLLAPNVNSYRRLHNQEDSPINTQWGRDNRTVGLRVPGADAADRRIENRVPGADTNPYLAIAASLACGYLGMIDGLRPSRECTCNAYDKPFTLPRTLPEALTKLERSRPLREVLGSAFVDALIAVKQTEHDAYQSVVTRWEREHLLLSV